MTDFSQKGLAKLLGTKGARAVVHDAKTPGLRAELREGGSITFFVFKRRARGTPQRIKVGAFPAVTVEAARREALPYLADLSQGKDVAKTRRQRRNEATLNDLFADWLEYAKARKRTWEEDKRQFEKLLVGWHNRRLSAIHRSDLEALHNRVGKANGHYAANRLLALVRAMFNRASYVGFDGPNPTKGIKKFKEQSRDRFLQPDELPKFFAAIQLEPNPTLRDFFLILLYTGARRGNVQAMAWADVNLRAATWRIPETKSGEPVTLHLPAPAVEILKAREAGANGCPWVFPGGKKNRAGHLQSPKHAWGQLLERAGIKDLRLHDLRRTLGSYQAAAGASLAVIGKSLGHKPGSAATAVYARMNLDPVRASVDVAIAAIVAAGAKGGEKNGN